MSKNFIPSTVAKETRRLALTSCQGDLKEACYIMDEKKGYARGTMVAYFHLEEVTKAPAFKAPKVLLDWITNHERNQDEKEEWFQDVKNKEEEQMNDSVVSNEAVSYTIRLAIDEFQNELAKAFPKADEHFNYPSGTMAKHFGHKK